MKIWSPTLKTLLNQLNLNIKIHIGNKEKPVPNIVYDGHAQQKLVTSHIRDRSVANRLRCAAPVCN